MSYTTSTSASFALTAGQSVAVRTQLNEGAKVRIQGVSADREFMVNDANSKTFGPFTEAKTVTVSALYGTVEYDYGTAPSLPAFVYSMPQTESISGARLALGYGPGLSVASSSLQVLSNSGVADLTGVTNLHAGNMTRFRAAKQSGAASVLSIIGNSQVMGAGAGTGGTEACTGAKPRNMPTMLARELTRKGMYARAGNFCGDQNAGGVGGGMTYELYDPTFVMGAAGQWLQTSLGRLMVRSTGAGLMCTITPPASFDTIHCTFVSNGTIATIAVDGGASLGNIYTLSDSRIAARTFTTTEDTHVVTITANEANVFLRSVRFTSSTRPGVSIVQNGWYGAVATNFNSNANAWDTYNTIRYNPDGATAVLLRCLVNDCNGVTDPVAWQGTMRVICQGIIAGGSDLILSTDEPYQAASSINGRAQQFIDLQKALAAEFDCPHIDLFQRYGPAYEALPGDYFSGLHCGQPRQLTTAQAYAAFLAAV